MVLFLYGMKIMSEALQKIAGQSLRSVLTKITSNPGRGILTGFLITSLIQSSSATTVMLVSFVNAGLVSFTQSLGVIFGANIGTTLTAWLISILGFGVNFNLYSIILPLVALSLPLFFSYKNKSKAWAEFIIGFALLFIGIYFFKENVPVIDEYSTIWNGLEVFEHSFLNILIFVGFGILITIVFQSSSATITLTMILTLQGWLSFDGALAMVLGENIGTAATANFAAIMANRTAKRTALAHLLFNVIGMMWALPMLVFFSGVMQSSFSDFGLSSSDQIIFGIPIFHTLLNVLNTLLLMILFVPFKKLCFKLLPNGEENEEVFNLKYIDNNLLSTSELSILQVRKEIANMGKQVSSIFLLVPELLSEKKEKRFNRLFDKIKNGEEMMDVLEKEIAAFISKISKDDLSDEAKIKLKAMLKIIDYLESISDFCFQMAIIIHKKKEANAWFTQELRKNLRGEFSLIEKSLNLMVKNLEKDYKDLDSYDVQQNEKEIRRMRGKLNAAYLEEVKREKLPIKTGVFFSDLLHVSEKIGNYAYLINEAMHLKYKNVSSKYQITEVLKK